MRLSTIGAVTSLFLAPSAVLGHGWVHRYITATDTYLAPDAYNGAVNTSLPIRWYEGSGPAAPFTGTNITCGPGGNVPTNALATVAAGSYVIFDWDSWQSSHSGPVMTYVAYCPSGCANFKGDSGNIWIKIQQDAYNPDRTAAPWGENLLHTNPQFKVTIPASLAPGEYIIRHEILGLHVAGTLNGAQFYPNCLQIKVTGSGTQRPTGIALPGAYDPNDPGILVELWRISPTSPAYTAPGGGVQLGGSWLPSPTSGVTSATATSTNPTSTSTAKPTSTTVTTNKTTSTTKTSATPTQTSGGAALYGQCGGQGWTGPTTCAQGTCTYSNAFYSQCLP